MLIINEQDLYFKGNTTIFTTKIKDVEMDNKIIKVIDSYGDRQNLKTNVKAQMTEWYMWKEEGFKDIAEIALEMSKTISYKKYNYKLKPVLTELWGMKYITDNYTVEHDHWPKLWSFVYYVTSPNNCPNLIFPELNEEIKIQQGLLVMFDGKLQHSVPKTNFEDFRYTVSGNITEDIKI